MLTEPSYSADDAIAGPFSSSTRSISIELPEINDATSLDIHLSTPSDVDPSPISRRPFKLSSFLDSSTPPSQVSIPSQSHSPGERLGENDQGDRRRLISENALSSLREHLISDTVRECSDPMLRQAPSQSPPRPDLALLPSPRQRIDPRRIPLPETLSRRYRSLPSRNRLNVPKLNPRDSQEDHRMKTSFESDPASELHHSSSSSIPPSPALLPATPDRASQHSPTHVQNLRVTRDGNSCTNNAFEALQIEGLLLEQELRYKDLMIRDAYSLYRDQFLDAIVCKCPLVSPIKPWRAYLTIHDDFPAKSCEFRIGEHGEWSDSKIEALKSLRDKLLHELGWRLTMLFERDGTDEEGNLIFLTTKAT